MFLRCEFRIQSMENQCKCVCLCAGNGVSAPENGDKEKLASLPSCSLQVCLIPIRLQFFAIWKAWYGCACTNCILWWIDVILLQTFPVSFSVLDTFLLMSVCYCIFSLRKNCNYAKTPNSNYKTLSVLQTDRLWDLSFR